MILEHIFVNTKVPVTHAPAAQMLVSDFIKKFSLNIHGSRAGTMLFLPLYGVHLTKPRVRPWHRVDLRQFVLNNFIRSLNSQRTKTPDRQLHNYLEFIKHNAALIPHPTQTCATY